jgi:hypothetical protein
MPISPPVTLPFTFVNGTTADATQVDANFNTLLGVFNTNVRTVLTAPTTFYVAPGGVDFAGNGLSPLSPAATIQYIYGLLMANYDLSGLSLTSSVTISMADGAYSQSPQIGGLLPGQQEPNQLIIQGDMGNPALVTWTGDPCLNVYNSGACRVQGVTMSSAISQCIVSQHGGNAQFVNCVFFPTTANHLVAARSGVIQSVGNYTINGGGMSHAWANGGQIFISPPPGNFLPPATGSPTVTLIGAPAFSVAFGFAQHEGLLIWIPTVVGTATGQEYLVNKNGLIDTAGLGMPGSIPGVADGSTGGYFI